MLRGAIRIVHLLATKVEAHEPASCGIFGRKPREMESILSAQSECGDSTPRHPVRLQVILLDVLDAWLAGLSTAPNESGAGE